MELICQVAIEAMKKIDKITSMTLPERVANEANMAINLAIGLDREFRVLNDNEIIGKAVTNFSFGLQKLALELDRKEWLVISCQMDQFKVSLNKFNEVLNTTDELCNTIIFKINEYEFTWNPYEILSNYQGHKLKSLWFGEHSLMLYFQKMPILQCIMLYEKVRCKYILCWEPIE
jgi:hypothetical protein